MSRTVTINKTKTTAFTNRWNKLVKQHAKVDFEMATLAAEIRNEIPVGSGGDYQFKRWVSDALNIGGTRAQMLLDVTRARVLFPTEQEWIDVGGWRAIGFLTRLSKMSRSKMRREIKKKLAKRRGKAITYDGVRTLGFAVGVTSAPSNGGRPSFTENEARIKVLSAYINGLHNRFELPQTPGQVRKAMTTRLGQIATAARTQ